MKIGVAVPNIGPVATPEAVKTVAQRAERLLWPVSPKLPYPVTPDGSLPEEYKYTHDPLDRPVEALCPIAISLTEGAFVSYS